MFDRTDLDLRYRHHAALVAGARHAPASVVPAHRGPRVLVADLLLTVCRWLAPEEVQRVRAGKPATV